MQAFKFNVGSAVNGQDKALSRETVLQALWHAGFTDAEIIKEAMSDTETTYVIEALKFRDWHDKGHESAVFDVCEALHQDAIAYKVTYSTNTAYCGFLVGPKAEDWGGEFNPEYFID